MIHEPCKIKDFSQKQFSFRPNDSPKKGKIKLKPFMTDYTRVNNYLSSHKEELDKYSHKEKNELNYNITENANIHNNINGEKIGNIEDENNENKIFYLQPIMKFAPRTEFERIFDTLNSYDYGRIDKNLIKEQLKALGFLTIQNYNSINYQNEYSLLKEKFKVSPQTLSYLKKEKKRLAKEEKTPEIQNLLTNISDIIKINKEIKHDQETPEIPIIKKENHKRLNIAKKKIINNYLAKNILSEYQKKTHFKALLDCTLNLDKNNKHKSLSENNRNNKIFSYNLYNNKNITLRNNSCNKIVQKTCVKPFHNKKKYPEEDMEYLKKLCNMTHNEYFKHRNQTNNSNDDGEEEQNKFLKHENIILINGVAYNKKDLPKISKVILKECNYIKNFFNKEKIGAGKTMITRGLSVNEFTQKYGLPK